MLRQYPEEILVIYPQDGIIREVPFNVQVWFNYEPRNVVFTTSIDSNPIQQQTVYGREFEEEKYWKRYPGSKGTLGNMKNRWWIVGFQHYLTDLPMVKVNMVYDYDLGDDNWVTDKEYSFILMSDVLKIRKRDIV